MNINSLSIISVKPLYFSQYNRMRDSVSTSLLWQSILSCCPPSVCRYKRESLKILGTVGEPINPEAWQWYYSVVGEKRCPIVDTFWQTETVRYLYNISPLLVICNPPHSAAETADCWLCCPLLETQWTKNTFLTGCFLAFQGGHVLTPLPAATPMKPGSAVS